MITSSIRITTSDSNKKDILEILLSVKGPTEGIPGCLGCCIYEDIQDRNCLNYSEIWQNKDALELHIRSKLYRNMLAAIDMSREHPDINFSLALANNGMGFIREALTRESKKYKIEFGI